MPENCLSIQPEIPLLALVYSDPRMGTLLILSSSQLSLSPNQPKKLLIADLAALNVPTMLSLVAAKPSVNCAQRPWK